MGNIARKLRLLGYDSQYFSDIDDEKLIDSTRKEKRIIISKDDELIKKAQKLGARSIHITREEEIEEFLEIINSVNLKRIQINGNIARCTKCNSLTESVDKEIIKERIPQGVLKLNDKFCICQVLQSSNTEKVHILKICKSL